MALKGASLPLGILTFGAVALLLVSAVPPMAVHATISTCSGGTGCWIWWQSEVWNGRYVGNTLEFDLYLFNTYAGTPTDTVSSVQLVTPWGTSSDNTLPQALCYGCQYSWSSDFTIPSTATPGDYNITFTFTGTYGGGGAFCAAENNVCSGWITVDVSANPDTLQSQIVSLQGTITSLNQNVTSLNSKVSTLQSQAALIQSQLTTAKGNATLLQASLSSTESQLTLAKRYLASNETALASANASLAATQASLSNTQSSLSTESNVYLPLGVAVPSIVAILLAVLYWRKKPKPMPT